MDNENYSKIKKNGRPKLSIQDKKTHLVKCMMDEKQIQKLQELNSRFAPYLNQTDFARAKILDENLVRYGIRDLPEEELNMLKEIALLGNQFKMVASRNNITFTQERLFKEDTQKIREILDSSHRKVLEFQQKELYYFKIGIILEKFNKIISEKEKYQNCEILVSEITSVVKDLNEIYQSILSHKK